MPMSEAELQTEYDRLTTLIQEVTATPKPSYRVGGVTYNWTEYLRELREQRKDVLSLLQGVPYEGMTVVDFPDE